jgi:acylphosphatase
MASAKAKTARKYKISGRVQGVGFRYFAERAAGTISISGYVKNCADGTVEVYAIGEAPALEAFRRQLAEGPRSARVEKVEESEMPVKEGYKGFKIEGGW